MTPKEASNDNNSNSDDDNNERNIPDVIRLWQLPDNFFRLSTEKQWDAIKSVTHEATPYEGRRRPCPLSLYDEVLSVGFFSVVLGVPFALAVAWIFVLFFSGDAAKTYALRLGVVSLVLALHPLVPQSGFGTRYNRLAIAIMRYFTMEGIVDRNDQRSPLTKHFGTPYVDTEEFQKTHLPAVYLACPHGVFNLGAMSWCTFSRWIVGWNQFVPAADVVKHVPGLRYMEYLVWMCGAGSKSITDVLQQKTSKGGRSGGMIGINPDGILGAFRTKYGVDELVIGKRRGLMRLAAQNSATVGASWWFGTSEMLVPVQDPWGIQESLSRKFRAGMMGFRGRWCVTPIPNRTPCTFVVACHRCERIKDPTPEDLDRLHDTVYGNLQRVYDEQKKYAGYPDRTLQIQ